MRNTPKTWQWGAAILAAPLFWVAWFCWTRPGLHPGWPLEHPDTFLLLVLIYPVLEEVVFRGLIQDWAGKRLAGCTVGPVTAGNLATSTLFTLAHVGYHATPWALLVVFPSLVFGWLKDQTGSLIPPIGLHIFYNAGFVWLFITP